MSVTSIVVIFLVVCMALGPVFMLQPSRRQKKVASLRTEAARLGIKVRMQKFGDDDLAVYSLPWPSDPERKYSGAALYVIKKDYEHGLHLKLYWELKPRQAADQQTVALLEELISCIPEGVVGIELTPGGLGLCWQERSAEGVLSIIHERLRTYTSKFWMVLSVEKQKL